MVSDHTLDAHSCAEKANLTKVSTKTSDSGVSLSGSKDDLPVWKTLLKHSVTTFEELDRIMRVKLNPKEIQDVIQQYPVRINPYYLSLIQKKDDPIWKQC